MPKREARPNARVGLHAAEHYAKPLEKLFVEFVRPLTRTKCGNSAILVVLDSFSKFVTFFPVRRMASSVVIDCLEKGNLIPNRYSDRFLPLFLPLRLSSGALVVHI